MVFDTPSTLLLPMRLDIVDLSSSRAAGNNQEAALTVAKAGVFGL